MKYLLNNNKNFLRSINDIFDKEIEEHNIEGNCNFNELFYSKFFDLYNHDKYEAKKYYYKEKFNIDIEEDNESLNNIILNYIEGLQWF